MSRIGEAKEHEDAEVEISQSLANLRQRFNHVIDLSTIQRLGNTANPLAWPERLTISVSRWGRIFAGGAAPRFVDQELSVDKHVPA